jgi:hypothetical protein
MILTRSLIIRITLDYRQKVTSPRCRSPREFCSSSSLYALLPKVFVVVSFKRRTKTNSYHPKQPERILLRIIIVLITLTIQNKPTNQ